MTKEELIQQMEICVGTIDGEHPYECPKDCPMRQVDFCTMYIIKDALKLLKEQEPREQEAQRDYEAQSDMRDYCERYESTYNPDDGSM